MRERAEKGISRRGRKGRKGAGGVRVSESALVMAALAAAAVSCEATLDEDCPAGTTRRLSLCVPDRLAGDECDADRDDFLAVACGGDDCDDDDSRVHPRASETCNAVDDDCDGSTDEGAPTAWYLDGDGDGAGAGDASFDCPPSAGRVAVAGDCDDSSPEVHHGATETCDGRDEDCDGFTDEGTALRFYRDDDHDDFGDPADFVDACALPDGFTTATFDCDDAEPDAHPDQLGSFAVETASGGFDYDCDGEETPEAGTRVGDCSTCTAPDREWLGDAPPCGGTGTLLTCVWTTGTGCREASRDVSATQGCR